MPARAVFSRTNSLFLRHYELVLNAAVDFESSRARFSKDILSLSAWKTNNKQHDIECELEKYVLILILYGYSQQFIKIIRKETIEFATRNKVHFKQLKPEDLKNLDHWLMGFELENGRKPKDINEFIEFYNEAKS